MQTFKHHDFIFKVSTPPRINSYTWVTMWSKTSLEEGPILQKLRENAHSIFHRPRAFYTAHLVLLRIWRVLCYAYERITNYIGSKFEMWLLIYAAHQNKKIAKIQASLFHFHGEYPPPHKLLHMGHNVVKNILRRGSHFTKIARKYPFYFSQALIARIIMHIQHPLGNTERFSTKEKWNDVSK